MNERIKNLLIQNKDNFSYSVTSVDGKVYIHGSEDNLEKFADLIVKEMLRTCENHPGWTGRMIGEQIKQHFDLNG